MNSTIRLSAWLVAAALLATACGGRSLTAPAPIPALSAAAGTTGAMSLAYPAYPEPGRVEYRVGGTLPSLSGHAAAYRLGHETTEGQVAHLATALGVNGTVSADPMGWTVTGPAAGLHVTRVAGLPWSLSPSSGSGVSSSSGCAVAMPAGPASAPGSAPSSAGKAPLPAPAPACPSPTAVPGLSSRADAEQRARSVLSLAGLDLSGATVESSGGITEWLVSVTPAVGGVRMTGAGWSVALGAHGSLQWASGWLASPASAGDYPLVGVQAGFDRLRRGGTWIVRGGPGPMPMMGMMGGVSGAPNAVSQGSPVQAEPPVAPVPPPHSDVVAPAPPVGVPCPPGAKCSAPRGEPAPVPAPAPIVLTVTGVHLGLAWGSLADGGADEAWLVPVYVFELGGGGTVPVLAVSDRFITPPPTVPPVKILPAPVPLPAQPPNNQAPAVWPAPATTEPAIAR